MKTRYLLTLLGFILVLVLLVTSCSNATLSSTSIKTPTSSAPAASSEGSTTTALTTTAIAPVKPTGELVAAIPNFGNENFIPWKADAGASQIMDIVYDMLIYYDEVNRKFIPGLAESWDVSPDALTLTYHLRKGVQFSDGWGEFTSADVKYYFEMQASPKSVGKTADCRNIKSMETPDPYTLVVQFKKPAPTFFMNLSLGNGGQCQGIVSKKYVETAGETAAAQKPIGTGPYKLVESQGASYYKFEAMESHWRIVPEFKNLILRQVSEISTTVAMLKTKEIDLANVPAEQLADLKAAGLAIEVSSVGGGIFLADWGGMAIPEDSRYDANVHNKDPWLNPKVRKAMTISIDRQAICDAIFTGAAPPVGVPLFSADMDKYQYPYDPAAARELLKEAGYLNGFSFKVISYSLQGVPETPRVVEALAAYWQQIGLDPKITIIDYSTYGALRLQLKTAGEVSFSQPSPVADGISRAGTYLMPDGPMAIFQDEGSYAIWKEGNAKVNADERAAYVEKLNQYYFENYGPIPVVRTAFCYAWNPAKIGPWPHGGTATPYYFEYIRHSQPLNTFRLFTPWAGR